MDNDEIAMPNRFGGGIDVSALDFELAVKRLLDLEGKDIVDYSIKHREIVSGMDGDFEIDIYIEFSFLGAIYKTLIECKKYKNSVKREVVQVLKSKLSSIGAQKGIIFSTSGFQRGAVEFASKNGIALVLIGDGRKSFVTKSYQQEKPRPTISKPAAKDIWGWQIEINSEGNTAFSVIGYQDRKLSIL